MGTPRMFTWLPALALALACTDEAKPPEPEPESRLERLQRHVADRRFGDAYREARPIFETARGAEREQLWELLPAVKITDPDVRIHDEARKALHYRVGQLNDEADLLDGLRASDAQLEMSRRVWDREAYGTALLARAEILDSLGYDLPARQTYFEAQEWLQPWAWRVVWSNLKRALFTLDRSRDVMWRMAAPVERLEQLIVQAESLLATPQGGHLQQTIDAAHINLALAYALTGRPDQAERHLDALDPEQRTRDPHIRLTEARILVARQDDARARAILLSLPADALARDQRWERLVALGTIAARAGDVDEADRWYREAIAVVEATGEDTEILRTRVLAHRPTPYSARFELLMKADRVHEAIALADARHARSLFDAIAQVGPLTVAEELTVRVDTAREIADAPLDAPLGAADVPAFLGGREVLFFVEAYGHVWRVHALDGRIDVTDLDRDRAPADGVLARIDQWADEPDSDALAAELGARLLPAALGPATRPLQIIATGGLATVPFAALVHGGARLVDARTLVRHPALAALRCRAPRTYTGATMFLGDPTGDLPAAAREVTALAEAHATPPLVGPAATIARLDEVRRGRLLHIAAHGHVDDDGAGLRLADGLLDAATILRNRIGPETVVLAGCSTGTSIGPDGWRALPPAFLAAGSRAVIATVRDVPDEDAGKMMEAFYRHGGAERPAEALAMAQRALAKSMKASSWGSFAIWEAGCGR